MGQTRGNVRTGVGFIVVWLFLAVHHPMASATESAPLPLSKIVLYSSGVGYFQHDGTITNRAQLDLRFSANQINDLLKSLVVQDFGGGKVTTVTYGSRDPIAKALGSFGINLHGNPSLGQILTQVRGERVEVAAPQVITGTILGVEKKTESILDGQSRRVIEYDYLNLVTDEGFRSLPLTQIQRIKLTSAVLNTELQQALAIVANNHDAQTKAVSLTFDGSGSRTARVAYLTETPVWKTTYRLILEDNKAPYVQGWAIVENTTDQDWQQVKLSLVSGRPISFAMDLYQPLYNPRPVVQPELYANVKPQVYGDAVEELKTPAAAPPSAALGKMKKERSAMESFAAGRASVATEGLAVSDMAIDPMKDTASSALAQAKGELFEYRIDAPVTLAKHTSALLPIINQTLQGQKVSIYHHATNPKHPLNGYRLKNTSLLHLMQGPITLFDGGTYAGDGRIEDLPPGQDRFISYALDLKVEVEPKQEGGTQELTTVSLKKGTMLVSRRLIEDHTYLIKNHDLKPKTIVIEHPYRPEWKLVEPKDTLERTRDLYRFTVTTDPGKSATLKLKETLPLQESVHLMETGLDQIAYYQQAKEIAATVKEALQRVVQLRSKLDETRTQRTRQEQRISEITAEHGRIRENMQRLQQNSDLYARYVKKLDQQETELEKIRKDIETLRHTEEDQRRELQHYLNNLDVTG